ncbi:MAG: ribosomal-processing cysteine protease Prp [Bacilli bacterium]|nr:ribosomal-processing cysteine protease Prp [Bacilli bacterium]
MIKVDFVLKNNFYKELTIKGHANFDSYGKDIVCSAVSAIGVGGLNAIYQITGIKPDYEVEDGFIHLVFNTDEKSQTIAQTMLVQLQSIEESYNQYIKIKITTM